jgi:hypothetical protein
MVPTYQQDQLDTCRRDLIEFGKYRKNGTQKKGNKKEIQINVVNELSVNERARQAAHLALGWYEGRG